MQILSTTRLLLRSATEADTEALYQAVLSDPAVMRYFMDGKVYTRAQAARFVRDTFNHGSGLTGNAVLEEIESGDDIGFAGLLPCAPFGVEEIEFGFVLAQSAWGNGYASEIGRAQIDFGFYALKRQAMFAMANPANTASVRAITRLGLLHRGDIVLGGRGPRAVFSIGRA